MRIVFLGAGTLALILAGCSPKVQDLPKPKHHTDPPITVESGPGTAHAFGPMPDRLLRWMIGWKSMQLNALDDKPEGGTMSGVSGTIYDDHGKANLTFSSRTAIGDSENQKLRLHGDVRVTSTERQETLISDALAYDAAAKLLTATGNVRFQGNVGSIGTFSELMATSDYKLIGTPQMFKSTMIVPSKGPDRKAALLALAAIAATASANQSYSYRSFDGTVSLRYGDIAVSAQPDGTRRMDLSGGVDGFSKTQGIHVHGNTASVILDVTGKQARFRAIHLENSVRLVQTSPDKHTTSIACDRADYLFGSNGATVKATGHVLIINRDAKDHDLMSATGTALVASLLPGKLPKGSTIPLKGATLEGPVTGRLPQPPEAPGKAPTTVVVTGNRLIDRATTTGSEVDVEGNVVLTTKDGKLGPLDRIAIELDRLGKVLRAKGGTPK
jgi:hypothetical protein